MNKIMVVSTIFADRQVQLDVRNIDEQVWVQYYVYMYVYVDYVFVYIYIVVVIVI